MRSIVRSQHSTPEVSNAISGNRPDRMRSCLQSDLSTGESQQESFPLTTTKRTLLQCANALLCYLFVSVQYC